MKRILLLTLLPLAACTSSEEAPEEVRTRGDVMRDANGNGVEDAVDIANGTSLDENQNGIPDEVEDELRDAD